MNMLYMTHEKCSPPDDFQTMPREPEKTKKIWWGWGGKDRHDIGESLSICINKSDLGMCNRGHVPTYIGPTTY